MISSIYLHENINTMNNLHIALNDLNNASRIFKQAKSLRKSQLVENVYIAGFYNPALPESETISDGIYINRFSRPLSRKSNTKSKALLNFFSYSLSLSDLIKLFSVSIVFFLLNFFDLKNPYLSLLVALLITGAFVFVLKRVFKLIIFKYLQMIFVFFKIYLKFKDKNISIITIHNLYSLPAGALFKRLFNAKLVYDAHELETERNGLLGLEKILCKWIEKYFIGSADLITVVGESIADWYRDNYFITRPVVILNSPPKRNFSKKDLLRQNLGIKSTQKILLYQGLLSKARGVGLLLDTFKSRKDDSVVIVFMGYGLLQSEVQMAAEKYSNIYFHPAVSPFELLDYTSSADIGVALIENNCLSYFYCMPNKLFEYAMTGLPLLVSNMQDMSKTVSENQMGVVISDFTPQSISDAIDKMDILDLNQISKNAYSFAAKNAWEKQEKKLLKAYANL